MRILQINSVFGVGSTGIICRDLSEYLDRYGVASTTLYGRWPEQPGSVHAQFFGNRLSTYGHVAMTRLFDRHGLNSVRNTRRCIRMIEDFQPDIIHLHNIHGYFLHVGRLFDFLKIHGRPVVWTFHDCWSFTGHCPYFTNSGCEKWRTGCSDCPSLAEYPRSWFADRSAKNYAEKRQWFTGLRNLTIVTPSDWLAGLVQASFLKEYPVRTIMNGIQTRTFEPRPNPTLRRELLRGKSHLLLAVAGKWDERKNLTDVIRVAEYFQDKASVVVIGEIQPGQPQLPAYMIHIPRTENRQYLAELFSTADLFLNPTLEDNYPTVNLEAVACDLPVLTYRTGGSPEAMHGYGKVIESNTAEELADVIRQWMAGGLSFEAQKPAREALDFCTMAEQYLALYRDILDTSAVPESDPAEAADGAHR